MSPSDVLLFFLAFAGGKAMDCRHLFDALPLAI
jgi:hypothetical protein